MRGKITFSEKYYDEIMGFLVKNINNVKIVGKEANEQGEAVWIVDIQDTETSRAFKRLGICDEMHYEDIEEGEVKQVNSAKAIVTVKLTSFDSDGHNGIMLDLINSLSDCKIVDTYKFSNKDCSGAMYQLECSEKVKRILKELSWRECLACFDGPIPKETKEGR